MSTTLLVCLSVFMLRHLHERLLQLILSIPCIPDKKLSYLKKTKLIEYERLTFTVLKLPFFFFDDFTL